MNFEHNAVRANLSKTGRLKFKLFYVIMCQSCNMQFVSILKLLKCNITTFVISGDWATQSCRHALAMLADVNTRRTFPKSSVGGLRVSFNSRGG